MGHAGAIISGGKGTAEEKMKTMRAAGIIVVGNPALIGETVEKQFSKSAKRKNVERRSLLRKKNFSKIRN